MERRRDKVREKVVRQAQEMNVVESAKAAERYLRSFGFTAPQIMRLLEEADAIRYSRLKSTE